MTTDYQKVHGLTVKDSKKYIETYLEKYSSINVFMNKIIEDAKEKGFVETKYKRRRYLPNINSKNYIIRESAKRMAMNAPIQGTASDIMKIAMIRIYNSLKNNNLKSKMILQVHDEIIIDTFLEEKEIVTKIIKEEMENASKMQIKLKAELSEGLNWNDAK